MFEPLRYLIQTSSQNSTSIYFCNFKITGETDEELARKAFEGAAKSSNVIKAYATSKIPLEESTALKIECSMIGGKFLHYCFLPWWNFNPNPLNLLFSSFKI